VPVIRPVVKRYLLPALAFVLPFALYFSTTARDIYWLDAAEFVNCTATNGLAHPPGYPLLLLFTRLASFVPLPSFAFRIDLLAALFAALSCLVLFLLLDRLTRDRTAALLAALVWAVSYELWQQATAIEVYGLQVLIIALALFAPVSYAETGSDRMFLLLALVIGLGLANHLFVIFWIPGIIAIVYSRLRYQRNWQTVLAALLLLISGPLLYLTLLFRDQEPPGWPGSTT
jgi:4-amino-4-deoxy-L-arabinose transferase-like glycosyltransferase